MKKAMASRKPGYPTTIISPFSSEAHDPLWVPVSSTAFPESMMNFKNVAAVDRNEDEDDDYKGYGILQTGAKKRRLSAHQVQFLERSFDLENKLEPERKAQMAKELGLEPRQVAIWFQNRRARFKTKTLEKEYSELKDSYDKLKAECDILIKEKEHLKEEVHSLKDKLMNKGSVKLISSDKVGPVSPKNTSQDRKSNATIAKELPDQMPTTSVSRSSGMLDSDSPNFTDSDQPTLLLEPANSSHAFEPDCSDFSQEEGNNPIVPRLDRGIYCAPPTSSCGFGFMTELDQPQLWSWPY